MSLRNSVVAVVLVIIITDRVITVSASLTSVLPLARFHLPTSEILFCVFNLGHERERAHDNFAPNP